MEIPKLLMLLCCVYNIASEHSHTIPVEDYETELQVLGQHVEIPEHPVKVIKITKTIAVKFPVPYPVKVIEKVPYPVHVSKPYPVPVTQIVHVPAPAKSPHPHIQAHEALDAGHGGYQVQEGHSYEPSSSSGGDSFPPLSDNQSYQGNSNHGQHFGGDDDHSSESVSSYDAPSYYGHHSGDNEGHGSVKTKNYDQAIQQFLQKHSAGSLGGSGYPYH